MIRRWEARENLDIYSVPVPLASGVESSSPLLPLPDERSPELFNPSRVLMRDKGRLKVPHTASPLYFITLFLWKEEIFVHNCNKIYHTHSVEVITVILVLLNDLSRFLGEWRISKK